MQSGHFRYRHYSTILDSKYFYSNSRNILEILTCIKNNFAFSRMVRKDQSGQQREITRVFRLSTTKIMDIMQDNVQNADALKIEYS